jgi:hypothetical protein
MTSTRGGTHTPKTVLREHRVLRLISPKCRWEVAEKYCRITGI